MSFRIKIDHHLVETDSAGEAVEFLRRWGVSAEAFPSVSRMPTRPTRHDWGRSQVAIAWGLISKRPQQAAILKILLKSPPEGLYKSELLKELGTDDGKQLAGSLSGLAKYAKKLGFAPDSLCQIEAEQVNGNRTNRYTLGEAFRTALSDYLDSNLRLANQNGNGGGGDEGQEKPNLNIEELI